LFQQKAQARSVSQRAINGKIVFASSESGNYEIYLADPSGANRTQLTTNNAIDLDPTWSPDGRKVLFITNRDGNFEIYTMNIDGTNQTRLTNTPANEFDPVWAPSGSKIAFSSDATGNLDVYTMNSDGSAQTNLTNNVADDAFPTWTPDSSKLAFTSGRSGNADIFVMNANGSSPTNISNNPANDEYPAWSPNGRLISFSSDRFGTFDIFVMNTDGNAQMRLTSDPKEETYPAWSPDSSKLVFMMGTVESERLDNNDAFVMAANGSTRTNLSSGIADEILPDWQPLFGTVQLLNPIDDPGLFVRQQYLDFLGREPDPNGLAFWSNQIAQCGSNAQCISGTRVNVSAAFFLSIEFQQTGYLVYRSYKASFGDLPGAPVPLRFEEFLPDNQQVAVGLIVGQSGWEQVLEGNKQTFLADFVTRTRFTATYPTTLTPAQFVDALFSKAGVTPTNAERTAALNEFSGSSNTADSLARARALRRVAENATLAQKEFNKAFVLMQYFGYLRRNPYDSPESTRDFAGYNFWLNKLNQFNGNVVEAEMVKAFILSSEYRQRFGP
jgi:TolB protein